MLRCHVAKSKDEAAIKVADEEFTTLNRETREAAGKAQAIEDAVCDLKAVNPNKKAAVDKRTPTELLDLIEAKGIDVATALAALGSSDRQRMILSDRRNLLRWRSSDDLARRGQPVERGAVCGYQAAVDLSGVTFPRGGQLLPNCRANVVVGHGRKTRRTLNSSTDFC